ncbi:MAG: ribonuclease E/G [Candidatus Pelagibacter sp.]|nr:ribonuclease E/G [Candidatus Pelagibacter sp.]|tara:strand:- start:4930 stop:6864 length:1935 start_codon:yes stop_codon:yes gene_type:complete
MEKNLYIDASHPDETRIVLKSENAIEEYEYEDKNKLNSKNNIYLGTISRVEPSLQAAFVDFGRTKHGFLAFNDIQSDYYQIPTEDKEKLKHAEEKIREDLKNSNVETSNNLESNGETLNNSENNELAENKNLENNAPSSSDENNNGSKPVEINDSKINDKISKNKYREKLKNTYGVKRYRIQEVIKPGQVILIQVLKDERGQKGAALTTFISLAGKYMVLMPNTAKGGGISRKIFNSTDREKIKKILNEIEVPKSMGVIVRTAGSNKSKNEIEKDFQNTLVTWEQIKNKAVESNAPSLIYEEGDIIKRALRDIYDNETKNIYVDGNEGYQKAKVFMKELVPKNVKFIKKYRGKIPLFHEVGIEKELNNVFEPTVKLKSGGYLVINPTEALVAIDINSGQSTKAINIEKTALNTNIEAAEEIAKQIKIRDLSGLIVIDFIDMLNFYNRRTVEKKMRESIRKDRARIQVGKISNFGLLEMTRQRLRESNIKWETNLSIESFALKIIKKVEMLAFTNKIKFINVFIPEKIQLYINTFLKKEIDYFQKKYNFKIDFIPDPELVIPEYSIKLLNKNKKIVNIFENLNKIKEIERKLNFSSKAKNLNNAKVIKITKVKKLDKTKKNIEKIKNKQTRILWTRRKKKVKSNL